MAKTKIQNINKTLPELSNGNKKKVRADVIDEIKNVADLMREKNNIYKGSNYRLDAKPMANAGDGFKAKDYKIDIQTVTRQKKHSITVAFCFLDPTTTNDSLADLTGALEDTMNTRAVYRVS